MQTQFKNMSPHRLAITEVSKSKAACSSHDSDLRFMVKLFQPFDKWTPILNLKNLELLFLDSHTVNYGLQSVQS